MKATLVLLPLLGITYMLFFVNPGEDEVSRVVFIYFNSFLESFQVLLPVTAPWPGRCLLGWGFSQAGPWGGRSWGEKGVAWKPGDHIHPRPLTCLPPPQGFFVSVFYCFLNSEVRTLGPRLRMA